MHVAIVAGPDPARAFPAAALALGLTNNGDDVLMLTGRRWVDRLRQLGIEAEEMAGLPGEPGTPAELRHRTPEHAAAMAPAMAERIADWRPDLVVADVQSLVGAFAAEMLGLRFAQLHPHPLTASSHPGPATTARKRGRAGWRSREGQRLSRISRQPQRELAAARASLDLPPLAPRPLMHMVATLPALEPLRSDWPRNAIIVGPLTFDPAVDDLPIPEGQAPLVMVSPSTAPTNRSALLTSALAGLGGLRVVATVLEPFDGPVPAWANVGIGRQEPLLAQAAVVVTGGGHGMIVRALTAGVPLVLAPGDGDGELELARRAERLGAAVILRRVTPRSLRRAVDKVIKDRAYASAARLIARTVATADPIVLCRQTTLVGRSVA